MKKPWRILLAVLLCTLCLPALAESGIMSGISVLDAYDEMLSCFDMGDYSAARELMETYSLAEKNVKDAPRYSNYLDALACMDAGTYDLAAYLFQGLADGETPFLNSLQLFHYCTGRHAQAQGNYDQAISSYTQAAPYDDASQRMLECIDLREQAKAAAAKASYDAASLLQDVDMLEAAAQLYADLGDTQMVAQIRSEILGIEKHQEYLNAVVQYDTASAQSDAAVLTELAAYFATLGEYENSAALAQACQEQLAALSRVLSFSEPVAAATTLHLTWSDSAPDGGSYTISYTSERAAKPQTVTVNEQQAILEGLLPATAYTVTLTAEGLDGQILSITAETLPAATHQGAGFAIRSSRLVGMKASYLNYYSLEQLLDEKQTVLTYFDDGRLLLKATDMALQPLKYCYIFSYQQDEAMPGPVELLWVLRGENAGVYAHTQSCPDGLPAAGRLFTELEPLFSPIYQELGAWPQGSMTLEVYINGALAARGAILLQQE